MSGRGEAWEDSGKSEQFLDLPLESSAAAIVSNLDACGYLAQMRILMLTGLKGANFCQRGLVRNKTRDKKSAQTPKVCDRLSNVSFPAPPMKI